MLCIARCYNHKGLANVVKHALGGVCMLCRPVHDQGTTGNACCHVLGIVSKAHAHRVVPIVVAVLM